MHCSLHLAVMINSLIILLLFLSTAVTLDAGWPDVEKLYKAKQPPFIDHLLFNNIVNMSIIILVVIFSPIKADVYSDASLIPDDCASKCYQHYFRVHQGYQSFY